ncbi:MAG: hypothetical protein L0Z62_02780 [Gemmataceae bacterium]|nr:hypothetical protein [Gemmataceae bacterium]
MNLSNDPSHLLRLALRANALFSSLSALLFLAAASPIASFLGFLNPQQILILGLQLAGFALWLFWLSRRPVIPRWQVWVILALDVLWVAGSFQLLLAPPPSLTADGKWSIGIVADVVGLFALLQALGLRRLGQTESTVPPVVKRRPR